MLPTLQNLIDIAKQAGGILRAGYGKSHQVQHKGLVDLVTEMDHLSEAYILEQIRTNFAGHTICAEESGLSAGDNEHIWYVDPLDGTVNYAHHIPIFTVSIAYAHAGKTQFGVVYDPMRDECFTAERGKGACLNGEPIHATQTGDLVKALLVTGFPYDIRTVAENNIDFFEGLVFRAQGIRRLGSAALDLAYVAAGRLDGYWEVGVKAWDIAAGGLIAAEAGAKISSVYGDPDYLKPPYSLIAANPELHARILEVVQEVARKRKETQP